MSTGKRLGGNLKGGIGIFLHAAPHPLAKLAPGTPLGAHYRAFFYAKKKRIQVHPAAADSPPATIDLRAAAAALLDLPAWRARFGLGPQPVSPRPTYTAPGYDPITKIRHMGALRFAIYAQWLTELTPADAVDVAHRMAVMYRPPLAPSPLASRAVWQERLGAGAVPEDAIPLLGDSYFALSQLVTDEAKLAARLASGAYGQPCVRGVLLADRAADAQLHKLRTAVLQATVTSNEPDAMDNLAAMHTHFFRAPDAQHKDEDPLTLRRTAAAAHLAVSGIFVDGGQTLDDPEWTPDAAELAHCWTAATRFWD